LRSIMSNSGAQLVPLDERSRTKQAVSKRFCPHHFALLPCSPWHAHTHRLAHGWKNREQAALRDAGGAGFSSRVFFDDEQREASPFLPLRHALSSSSLRSGGDADRCVDVERSASPVKMGMRSKPQSFRFPCEQQTARERQFRHQSSEKRATWTAQAGRQSNLPFVLFASPVARKEKQLGVDAYRGFLRPSSCVPS
jgi:hypothetical protein